MSITVHERDRAAVIEIRGKFHGSLQGKEFEEILKDLKKRGKTRVVVDLGRTDFMDSSAVGTLIGGLTSLRNAGGDMRLANLTNRIHGLFVMTRLLGPVFENHESVEEAIESLEHAEPDRPVDVGND